MRKMIVVVLSLPIVGYCADNQMPPIENPKIVYGPPPIDYFHRHENERREPVFVLLSGGGGTVLIENKFELPNVKIQSTLGKN